MISDVCLILGCLLLVAGLGFIYWPLALITSGLTLIVAGYFAAIKEMAAAKAAKRINP